MNDATNTARENVTCPKCSGKGHIEAFSGTANGKCFACWGAGTVSARKPSVAKAMVRKVNLLRHTAEIAMAAAFDGNDERCSFYLGRMVPGMFEIGTENARKVLAHIRRGVFHGNPDYYGDDSGNGRETLSREVAAAVAAELIALGREAKAA